MRTVETLIEARWIVPVVPKGVVLTAHAVAIDNGRIVALGPQVALREKYRARRKVELTEHVLIPGLVNAHTHAAMSLFRGLGDDMALEPWLQRRIWPAEAHLVNREFVADGTELAIAEMLRGGVTCAVDMYFFPDVAARTAQAIGFRIAVGLIVIEFPNVWAAGADECFTRGLALHDELKDVPLVTTVLAPHAPYSVSDGSFQRIRLLADQLDLPVTVHLHETRGEIDQSRKEYGLRPFARLQKLGLVNERLLAVHMTQLDDEEVEACARYGVSVAHCPESNLKLASGFCPVQALRLAGVNMALGTDGAASNNDLDMLGEMRSAALLAKAVANDAEALTAAAVLEMATIDGARALGLEQTIGSLEVGKQADMAAIDLNTLESTPMFDVHSHLVYAAGRHQVTDVWVAGQRLLNQRRLTSIDVDDLSRRARQWQIRVDEQVFQAAADAPG